jgi:hypothetical protein
MTKFQTLDLCLDLINRLGESGSITVTLIIGSAVISGNLIHPVAYFKAVHASLSRAYGSPEESAKGTKTPKSSPKEIGEIFLKNATMWRPAPTNSIDEPIAISMDSIDGFILGKSDLSVKLPEFDPVKFGTGGVPGIHLPKI